MFFFVEWTILGKNSPSDTLIHQKINCLILTSVSQRLSSSQLVTLLAFVAHCSVAQCSSHGEDSQLTPQNISRKILDTTQIWKRNKSTKLRVIGHTKSQTRKKDKKGEIKGIYRLTKQNNKGRNRLVMFDRCILSKLLEGLQKLRQDNELRLEVMSQSFNLNSSLVWLFSFPLLHFHYCLFCMILMFALKLNSLWLQWCIKSQSSENTTSQYQMVKKFVAIKFPLSTNTSIAMRTGKIDFLSPNPFLIMNLRFIMIKHTESHDFRHCETLKRIFFLWELNPRSWEMNDSGYINDCHGCDNVVDTSSYDNERRRIIIQQTLLRRECSNKGNGMLSFDWLNVVCCNRCLVNICVLLNYWTIGSHMITSTDLLKSLVKKLLSLSMQFNISKYHDGWTVQIQLLTMTGNVVSCAQGWDEQIGYGKTNVCCRSKIFLRVGSDPGHSLLVTILYEQGHPLLQSVMNSIFPVKNVANGMMNNWLEGVLMQKFCECWGFQTLSFKEKPQKRKHFRFRQILTEEIWLMWSKCSEMHSRPTWEIIREELEFLTGGCTKVRRLEIIPQLGHPWKVPEGKWREEEEYSGKVTKQGGEALILNSEEEELAGWWVQRTNPEDRRSDDTSEWDNILRVRDLGFLGDLGGTGCFWPGACNIITLHLMYWKNKRMGIFYLKLKPFGQSYCLQGLHPQSPMVILVVLVGYFLGNKNFDWISVADGYSIFNLENNRIKTQIIYTSCVVHGGALASFLAWKQTIRCLVGACLFHSIGMILTNTTTRRAAGLAFKINHGRKVGNYLYQQLLTLTCTIDPVILWPKAFVKAKWNCKPKVMIKSGLPVVASDPGVISGQYGQCFQGAGLLCPSFMLVEMDRFDLHFTKCTYSVQMNHFEVNGVWPNLSATNLPGFLEAPHPHGYTCSCQAPPHHVEGLLPPDSTLFLFFILLNIHQAFPNLIRILNPTLLPSTLIKHYPMEAPGMSGRVISPQELKNSQALQPAERALRPCPVSLGPSQEKFRAPKQKAIGRVGEEGFSLTKEIRKVIQLFQGLRWTHML
ncbi:uncharacterized protein VP01_2283g1, partial [Puccinia sorghi]